MSFVDQFMASYGRAWSHISGADDQNSMRRIPESDIFPATIIRLGTTAEGPGVEKCRGSIHPSTDNISDAAVYLLTFAEYSLERTKDECVKLYGDGDEEKENSIRNGWSVQMIGMRMWDVVDGLRGVDRSGSYGPRIRDVIKIIREEGGAEVEASRIEERIFGVLNEA
ncbi:hypothetical protein HCBG_05237 [Histoplasma capsulatum G186AR]|uniref:Uncharacterized protein n=2 Tax=Ajellomyces capsulatus TaxID=5037 RepID=C0NQ07_AJECG|nr:uncharacterized protein HCBG_05237 [Histoplasma capsulatum G186AR]EEH07017.1 hypothetical protein HCBG_05237 [Histoplasma capsulatum G186AR]KAG5293958.1 hypothetical protein I7I52_05446 [Histoplasma capsulatum]QSS75410.1 hypothetical protein I7I50_04537 [Histoplasma capsulatum G186AR]